MFQNLVIAFEAVIPLFITLAVGYASKKTKMLDEYCIKHVNKMLFNTLFPLIVVQNLYGASVKEAFDVKLIVYSVSMGLIFWLLAIPVITSIEKKNPTRGAMIQAINRSNFLVIGFPVVKSICGNESVASASLTVVGMLLVNNIMSVVVLEVFRGGKPNAKHILKEILTNPIIIATFVGIVLMASHVKLPKVIEKTVSSLGGIATPLALIIMGASLDIKNIGKRKRNIFICVLGKLIIIPGIVTSIGALLGFRGVPFVTLLAFFAASPTTTSYTMADQMDSDGDLARDSLVFSTLFVSLTMFCWIFIYKTIGMF